MEDATAWEPSLTPTSLSSEVVALFRGQGKGDRGRTPAAPTVAVQVTRSASPISRGNQQLPRPSQLPLSPPVLGWVRSSDAVCSQPASTHLPVPFPEKGTARLRSTPPLHAGTPGRGGGGRAETQVGAPRTLPEPPAPPGRGAWSPADLQPRPAGCPPPARAEDRAPRAPGPLPAGEGSAGAGGRLPLVLEDRLRGCPVRG